MAKKKAKRSPAPGKKRYRRTDEELIADLKDRIQQLKERQEAKKLKESPSLKRTMTAIRNIDKALDEAKEEGNTELRHALADARKPLAEYLDERGVKLPKPRLPRGRRPKRG